MGALLDTHALLWLVNGQSALSPDALLAIASHQRDRTLYVSPISGWELAVAVGKAPGPGRPDLGGEPAERWFREALRLSGAKLASITRAVAFEAAKAPSIYLRRDPGDCFLIATARVHKVPIITRDVAMHDLARDQPGYLQVISC